MMPDTRYCKVIFEDQTELDLYDVDVIDTAKSEAAQRNTKVNYILRGQDSFCWPYEFIPLQYFDADGNEHCDRLLAVIAERGLRSQNPYMVAASAMIVKHIQEETNP